MKKALFILVAVLAVAAYQSRPYDCATDTECEAQEAARCLIFCGE